MTTLKKTIVASVVALGFASGAAFAQTTAPAAGTAPATPAPSATAKAKAAASSVLKKATTPEGQACSAEADAQNLHGKPRIKFRKKCIAEKRKAAGAAKKS